MNTNKQVDLKHLPGTVIPVQKIENAFGFLVGLLAIRERVCTATIRRTSETVTRTPYDESNTAEVKTCPEALTGLGQRTVLLRSLLATKTVDSPNADAVRRAVHHALVETPIFKHVF